MQTDVSLTPDTRGADCETTQPPSKEAQAHKNAIRTSLKASTFDAVFAAMFTISTSGILLSSFLIELDATPVEVGMLVSIPMLMNLLQPLGAYLSEQTRSRYNYCLWTHGVARLLWLPLAGAIFMTGRFSNPEGGWADHHLVILTLVLILVSNVLTALGSPSWLSWMATLVPRQLRGRYFGVRNSAISLTQLLCIPMAGIVVTMYPGGPIQGYGLLLLVGILAGVGSLICQSFKQDINPQTQKALPVRTYSQSKVVNTAVLSINTEGELADVDNSTQNYSIWKNSNFLIFLLYFGLWIFSLNLSAPFFNLYMLDTLDLDVSQVSVYGSFQAAAGMLMLMYWGRLADRIGNNSILFAIGILVAVTPLLWIGMGTNTADLWLWLPLLHIFSGGSFVAIELCTNNLQLSIAPVRSQSVYFAIAAAVAGATGAMGTTIGGLLAQNSADGGLTQVFVFSSLFRLIALIPLLFIQEGQRQSFMELILEIWQNRLNKPLIQFVGWYGKVQIRN